jgi:tetratricopeptide (TPR) repeat protein
MHAKATDIQLEAAQACRDLADFWREHNRPADALPMYDRCRQYCEKALQTNSDDLRPRSVQGQAHDGRGLVLAQLNRKDEALAAHLAAAAHHQAAFAKAPKQTLHRERLSDHFRHLARLHRDQRRPTDAAAASLEQQKLWPANSERLVEVACDLASCIPLVGKTGGSLTSAEETERGRYAELAIEALRQAIANGYRSGNWNLFALGPPFKNCSAILPLKFHSRSSVGRLVGKKPCGSAAGGNYSDERRAIVASH